MPLQPLLLGLVTGCCLLATPALFAVTRPEQDNYQKSNRAPSEASDSGDQPENEELDNDALVPPLAPFPSPYSSSTESTCSGSASCETTPRSEDGSDSNQSTPRSNIGTPRGMGEDLVASPRLVSPRSQQGRLGLSPRRAITAGRRSSLSQAVEIADIEEDTLPPIPLRATRTTPTLCTSSLENALATLATQRALAIGEEQTDEPESPYRRPIEKDKELLRYSGTFGWGANLESQ